MPVTREALYNNWCGVLPFPHPTLTVSKCLEGNKSGFEKGGGTTPAKPELFRFRF